MPAVPSRGKSREVGVWTTGRFSTVTGRTARGWDAVTQDMYGWGHNSYCITAISFATYPQVLRSRQNSMAGDGSRPASSTKPQAPPAPASAPAPAPPSPAPPSPAPPAPAPEEAVEKRRSSGTNALNASMRSTTTPRCVRMPLRGHSSILISHSSILQYYSITVSQQHITKQVLVAS